METRGDGRFSLEIHDFSTRDLGPRERDTVAFIIHAFWPVTTSFLLRDSVIVEAEVAPVGERPEPVEATLTLSIPKALLTGPSS